MGPAVEALGKEGPQQLAEGGTTLAGPIARWHLVIMEVLFQEFLCFLSARIRFGACDRDTGIRIGDENGIMVRTSAAPNTAAPTSSDA